MTKLLNIDYRTNEDANNPETVRLNLNDELINKIKLAQLTLKEHGFYAIKIDIRSSLNPIASLIESDGSNSEFDVGVECLTVYEDNIVYFCQHGDMSSIQIESEPFNI